MSDELKPKDSAAPKQLRPITGAQPLWRSAYRAEHNGLDLDRGR